MRVLPQANASKPDRWGNMSGSAPVCCGRLKKNGRPPDQENGRIPLDICMVAAQIRAAANIRLLVDAATMIGRTREVIICIVTSCFGCLCRLFQLPCIQNDAAHNISQTQKSSGLLQILQLYLPWAGKPMKCKGFRTEKTLSES